MRSVTVVLISTCLLMLSACGGGSERPLPPSSPGPTLSPVPLGGWDRLAFTCPVLSGPVAKKLNVTGEGRSGPGSFADPLALVADCAWGSVDREGVAVTAETTIHPRQEAADGPWWVRSSRRTEKLSGIGDEAFIATEPSGVLVGAKSRNAIIMVRIVVPAGSVTTDRLAELRTQIPELAVDVLDDLRGP